MIRNQSSGLKHIPIEKWSFKPPKLHKTYLAIWNGHFKTFTIFLIIQTDYIPLTASLQPT